MNLEEMHIIHVLFLILCFNFCCEASKSILEHNDTALELLNNCKCTLKEYCYKGRLNVRGVGIITLRSKITNESELIEPAEIQCSKPSYICCKEPNTDFGNRVDNTLQLHIGDGKASSLTSQKDTFKVGKKPLKCGFPKPAVNIRISTGPDEISTALDGEFPWIASIYRKHQLDGSYQFRCGGSLINEIVVLTAAHCVYSSRKRPFELKVIANAKKELGEIGSNPSEEREVKKIVVHPKYYAGGAHNDIALIFLERSYNDSKDLNSICLPSSNSSYDNTRCLAAGWGDGNKKNNDGVKLLSKVELPLVDQKTCQEQLRKTRLGQEFELHESAICAGGQKDRDTCKGDGGGPLICPNEGGYFIQMGIVSWGVDCAKEGHPGVYTKVEKFVDWIHDNIRANS
ncbi:phenoloxidase-activating factor 2-like [Harmonia axyridis]|uniref:phenoloxidase-activating factor 2-like n=1 Tax=Harmonia axyridis TaxID=115357 RepID=UPI001E27948E|nr:phenoloxidase-activating factor 2-like [Harmonia axyridis]